MSNQTTTAAAYVTVTRMNLCGGSPRTPPRWVVPAECYLAPASEITSAGDLRLGWTEATHRHGTAFVRLASAEEAERCEGVRHLRPECARPLPPAPAYPRAPISLRGDWRFWRHSGGNRYVHLGGRWSAVAGGVVASLSTRSPSGRGWTEVAAIGSSGSAESDLVWATDQIREAERALAQLG